MCLQRSVTTEVVIRDVIGARRRLICAIAVAIIRAEISRWAQVIKDAGIPKQ